MNIYLDIVLMVARHYYCNFYINIPITNIYFFSFFFPAPSIIFLFLEVEDQQEVGCEGIGGAANPDPVCDTQQLCGQ